MPKKYLINLSGHPVEDKKWKGYIVVSAPIHVPNYPDPDEWITQAAAKVWDAIKSLGEDVLNAIAIGRYALLPPGHSALASIAISILHGLSGHFPKITVFVRTEEGFKLSSLLDLQDLRDMARVTRRFPTKK